MAPARRHLPATWRSTDGRIAAVGGKQGPAKRDIDADGLLVTPGLGRRAHPLRRPGDVGPAALAVVLARRHHRDVRQLRRRLRAGEEGASRRADGSDGGRRGNPQPGAGRGPELGVGKLPRIHERAGAPAARDRHRGADRALAAARPCDGRPRGAARGGDAGRHRRDAPAHHRGAAMRRVRLHHLAHRLAQDAGRRLGAVARRRRPRAAGHRLGAGRRPAPARSA